jgi:cell division cycle 14
MALSVYDITIIKERLFFNIMDARPTKIKKEKHVYWLHTDDLFPILYTPFAYDFGPPSIAQMFRFSQVMEKFLMKESHRVHLYSLSNDSQNSSNAVLLMASYCILKLGWSASKTEECFSTLHAFLEPFRDASESAANYRISVDACFHALEKAFQLGWINLNTFDYEEYTHYEQVENGDFNWIIPEKFIAMCSPTSVAKRTETSITHTPAYYVPYFKAHNVSIIIRLNNAEYDKNSFTSEGIQHYDMYFVDGTVPPISVVEKFLEVVENTTGVTVVHCKQGLGRTGTLIACYIMKHFLFSAPEAIAFIRFQRPGSVVGPQQSFLVKIQPYLLARESNSKNENSLGSPKCANAVITGTKKMRGTPQKICA